MARRLSLSSQVVDISVGGVMPGGACRRTCRLIPIRSLPTAVIDLPEGGAVVANLQLRWLADVVSRSGVPSKRAGFEFLRLPHAKSTLIQRYITKTERERKARDSGQL
jgi:c-di-GMP-binding flagellar brake protein YcgR